ncbi:glycosyltransferase family 39 protein [Caulobacter sp. 17J65-9]|uniref:ArnT family glycosyltransferase n=1 Tax=Caulobacter sp. 17J65-9 TaxID=2709382 RepID=UPI0013C93671|nr:glycosyltransferase family 39 protein [Caulobacter sp. 17J65-9]NEX92322.1 glycosyltransferase family 39 protein [Caulobacter sp. 17J65-9]
MTRFDIDRWIAGWRGPLLAALVALIAGLPGVFAMPPLDRDESRFAQATAQMLETDDFVNIQFQDQPRHKKPVGIHWLQAAAVSAVSDPEARDIWAYRIPSLLGAMLAAAACAWGATAIWGARAGVLAGVMLGASFLLSTEAFIAKTDAVLCGTVTLAMAALARLYLASRGEGISAGRKTKLLFWTAMAVAILVKGPIGPMVAGLAMITLGLWDRKWRWLKGLGWAWGLAIVLAVVGPWAVAITVATDGAFWGTSIGGDMAAKVAGGQEGHGVPPGLHTLLLPLLFYPGTLLLAAAAVTAWTRRAEPAVRFAIAWFLPAFVVFELVPTKLPHYPLPTYGAIAWLAAAALTQPIGPRARWTGVVLACLAALGVSAVAVGGLTQFGDKSDTFWVSLTVGFAMIGAFVGAYLLLNRAARTAMVVACAFGVLAHAALVGVASSLQPLQVSPRIEKALRKADLDPREGVVPGPVAVAGYAEPSLVFLLGTRTELLATGADAIPAVAQGRPVLIEGREENSFQQALAQRKLKVRSVDVVEGRNYSNGKRVRLTLYQADVARP